MFDNYYILYRFDAHKIVIEGIASWIVVNLNWLDPHERSFQNLLMICGLRNSRRNSKGSLTILMLYDVILRKRHLQGWHNFFKMLGKTCL
uniref:Putative ovule protein n=1 Tax=Solanum chacoense TaxID=4108 RepID=A0A0V0GX15_SOLCH